MFEMSTMDAQPATDGLRCMSGPWCRAATTIAGDRLPAITEHQGTICDACHKEYQSAVKHLPRDWAMLEATLGHRQTNTGEAVSSTPTPGINIDTGGEALMSRIAEVIDRAAAVVADALNTEQPDGRRTKLRPIMINGKRQEAEEGSIAHNAVDAVKPTDLEVLIAQARLVEPHIDKLAAVAPEPSMVWKQPRRCDQHHDQIARAETAYDEAIKPADRDEAVIALNTAYRAAGACDDCGGWGEHGQARELVEYSGIDICIQIVKAHQLTRQHLGHTRLRHNYRMPCPATDAHGNRCDAETVGRNDGSTIVDCTTCGACWTDREYKFLVGLHIERKNEVEITKWLLAEALWRLDSLRNGAEAIRKDPLLEAPASGKYVLDGIDIILAGHPTPDQRKNASDKANAESRQDDDDNWTWRNATTYQKPRARKRTTKKPRHDIPRIATSSLTTVVDAPPITDNRPVCGQCNEIHAGECA